ncbi:MAG TPA: polysaccharide biosynthesis/export family protein [Candidatus Cryptobacteroides sp.]|jgi:polysaccharide export outer membrane protein|nr:polysaccharide biosynthesis/export family protein [Candidatus Cryptobacteroides sp.]
MSRFFKPVLLATLALLLSGCASYKDIVYFQDIDERTLKPLLNEYEATIKKDDRLAIVVSGSDKTVTAPYNLTLTELTTSAGSSAYGPENATLSYLVDSDGNIEFPILGKIHVEGMTRNELVQYLTREIGKDVKDPIVYVNFKNFKFTVLGEVRAPGTYTIDSEKISVLQALGRAGDLNLTAMREGILLIREVDGVQKHYKINLKSSDLLESPYFYLQQNDVIYVPPSPTRVAQGTAATGLWSSMLSTISSAISIITLIVALQR